MGRTDYYEMAQDIMKDGDLDARIQRAVAKAEKEVPADESEGSDSFYAARRSVAIDEFSPEELGKMTAEQISTLFQDDTIFSEASPEEFDALDPSTRLEVILEMDDSGYNTEGGVSQIIKNVSSSETSEEEEMPETPEEAMNEEPDYSNKSFQEIGEELKNEQSLGTISTKNALKKGRGYDLTKIPESMRIRLAKKRADAAKKKAEKE